MRILAPLDPEDMVDMIEGSLDADKAEDVVVIDLGGKTAFADYMVIATGRNSRQLGAMAQHILEKLKGTGTKVSIEGMREGDWVLLDASDVIVHLFRPEVRAFYNLERMWGGGRAPAPARAVAVEHGQLLAP